MLISDANQTSFDILLNGALSKVKARILNSSVSLKGPNTAHNDFDASGAMLCNNGEETFLVSAKHNLEVYWNKGNRPPLNDIVDSFRQNVKIYYQPGMAFDTIPNRVADIEEVIPVTSVGTGEWDYDVMILKSRDPGLLEVSQANEIYPVLNSKQRQSYNEVATEERTYLSRTFQAKDVLTYFIQTGFGRVRDTVRGASLPTGTPGPNRHGGLQYRATAPMAQATVTVYNQVGQTSSYDRYDAAVQLAADANSSTARGDSGGPLYLAFYDKTFKDWRLLIIGVTTGGDMSTAQEPYPPQKVLVANNISTSLAACYKQGLFF